MDEVNALASPEEFDEAPHPARDAVVAVRRAQDDVHGPGRLHRLMPQRRIGQLTMRAVPEQLVTEVLVRTLTPKTMVHRARLLRQPGAPFGAALAAELLCIDLQPAGHECDERQYALAKPRHRAIEATEVQRWIEDRDHPRREAVLRREADHFEHHQAAPALPDQVERTGLRNSRDLRQMVTGKLRNARERRMHDRIDGPIRRDTVDQRAVANRAPGPGRNQAHRFEVAGRAQRNQRVASIASHARGLLLRLFNGAAQRRHRRRPDQYVSRQLQAQFATDGTADLHGRHGVPAEVEEIVVDANPVDGQRRRPDSRELALHITVRRGERFAAQDGITHVSCR